MAEITVKLPEPIYKHIRQQASEVNLSPETWLAQRLSHEFGIALITKEEAEQRALEILGTSVGSVLRTGTPAFDAVLCQWCVPVLPNLREDNLEPVGEICLDAATGKILMGEDAIDEMFARASPQLGIEKLPADLQKRIDELLDEQNNRSLTDAEQHELDKLISRWEAHNLNNLLRMTARLQPPKGKETQLAKACEDAKSMLRGLHER